MVFSSNNKVDLLDENPAGTCSADQLVRSTRRITMKLPIVKIPKLKEPNKKTVISSGFPLVKSSKYCENNQHHLDSVTTKSKKIKPLSDVSYSHGKKKHTSKSVTNEPSSLNAIKQGKIKKKKRRSTHIIIWESKLTGAQRVSKRLSNLRTKKKALGKLETFNLFPIAVIKKPQVKPKVQKKTKTPIKIKQQMKQQNVQQKVSIMYKNKINRVDKQVQKVYSKKETRKRKSSKHITKVCSDQTVKQVLDETHDKNNQLEESTDVKAVLSSCPDTNDVGEMEREPVLMIHEEKTSEETGCMDMDESGKDVDKINSVQPAELINSQNMTVSNENESANTMDVLQDQCFNDSEVIIVELEAVGDLIGESVDYIERGLACDADSDKKDTQPTSV